MYNVIFSSVLDSLKIKFSSLENFEKSISLDLKDYSEVQNFTSVDEKKYFSCYIFNEHKFYFGFSDSNFVPLYDFDEVIAKVMFAFPNYFEPLTNIKNALVDNEKTNHFENPTLYYNSLQRIFEILSFKEIQEIKTNFQIEILE